VAASAATCVRLRWLSARRARSAKRHGACVCQRWASRLVALRLATARASLDGTCASDLMRVPIDATDGNAAWHGAAPRKCARGAHSIWRATSPTLRTRMRRVRLPSVPIRSKCAVLCAGTVEPVLLLDAADAASSSLTRDLHVDVLATAVLLQACGARRWRRAAAALWCLVRTRLAFTRSGRAASRSRAARAPSRRWPRAAFEELRTARRARLHRCWPSWSTRSRPTTCSASTPTLRAPPRPAAAEPTLRAASSFAPAVAAWCTSCCCGRTSIRSARTKMFAQSARSAARCPHRAAGLVAPRQRPAAPPLSRARRRASAFACAERLAREGYDVALMARSPAPLEEARASCRVAAQLATPQMRAFQCDVGNRASLRRPMQCRRWRGSAAATCWWPTPAPIGAARRLNTDWRVWMDVLDTNLGHAVVATALVLPWMVHQRAAQSRWCRRTAAARAAR
jgi:hypothetical protein